MKIKNAELLIADLVSKFDDLAADRQNLEANIRGIVESHLADSSPDLERKPGP